MKTVPQLGNIRLRNYSRAFRTDIHKLKNSKLSGSNAIEMCECVIYKDQDIDEGRLSTIESETEVCRCEYFMFLWNPEKEAVRKSSACQTKRRHIHRWYGWLEHASPEPDKKKRVSVFRGKIPLLIRFLSRNNWKDQKRNSFW